jgi:hypothetical protein
MHANVAFDHSMVELISGKEVYNKFESDHGKCNLVSLIYRVGKANEHVPLSLNPLSHVSLRTQVDWGLEMSYH